MFKGYQNVEMRHFNEPKFLINTNILNNEAFESQKIIFE